MDAAAPDLFSAIKQRLGWLGRRQEVLARNIANADTPGYRPRELRPLRFGGMARAPSAPVAMTATNPAHLAGTRRRGGDGAVEQRERMPYETAPAGNAVVLEQQMAKLNETAVSHKLASELYRKHLGMIRTATGMR